MLLETSPAKEYVACFIKLGGIFSKPTALLEFIAASSTLTSSGVAKYKEGIVDWLLL